MDSATSRHSLCYSSASISTGTESRGHISEQDLSLSTFERWQRLRQDNEMERNQYRAGLPLDSNTMAKILPHHESGQGHLRHSLPSPQSLSTSHSLPLHCSCCCKTLSHPLTEVPRRDSLAFRYGLPSPIGHHDLPPYACLSGPANPASLHYLAHGQSPLLAATPCCPATGPSANNKKAVLYKTELCRSWTETSQCRYGARCQFSHGRAELRPVQRNSKFRTEPCRVRTTVLFSVRPLF